MIGMTLYMNGSTRNCQQDKMSPDPFGIGTSEVEVTNISAQGIWLLVGTEELFLSYKEFPWFKNASVGKILKVRNPTPGHLYWPELDVDLRLETIRHPDRFPLRARHNK